jgi:hypothetical protein
MAETLLNLEGPFVDQLAGSAIGEALDMAQEFAPLVRHVDSVLFR